MTRAHQGAPQTLDEVIDRAEALRADGHASLAASLYEQWIAGNTTPARALAWFNLGVLRSDLGELDAAATAYGAAIEVNPRFHQARINAGLVAERQGRDADAARHWLAVAEDVAHGHLETRPMATMALNHLGRLQEQRRHYNVAESALAHSLQLDPHQPDAIQHWVHLRQKQCKWPVYESIHGISVNRLMAGTSPLAMLALLDDPAMQWLTSLSFVSRKYTFPDVPRPPKREGGDGRIRIGYLSGDLCTHAVGLLMAELLEAHDHARVHITAFDFSPEDNTAHRARLKAAFDDVVPIHTLTDAAAADVIRARGIDILIDMHGLSSGARPGILAKRPAPLMGGYLGFIGTTALPWLDFVVTDRWTLPEAVAPYMTEPPLYIDGSMIPLYHRPVARTHVTRASVGLPEQAVVLACFNNIYKITPAMFACWLRVLLRVDHTVLWLLDDNPDATAALRTHATEAGVDPARIIFAGRTTHAEYRERIGLADIYLDTYPYNAGSTARDVLDALVPIVTLSGRTPVSRMAGGLLHAAGLDELITGGWDDYERLIVQLSSDATRRAAIRMHMRQRVDDWKAAPARFVRSLEYELANRLRGN